MITATYDAGGCGLLYRDAVRRVGALTARAIGRLTPGWLGWLCQALVWLVVVVLLRTGGSGGAVLDVLQLAPTVWLLLALALLLEQATSSVGPAANDNGSGPPPRSPWSVPSTPLPHAICTSSSYSRARASCAPCAQR